MTFLELCQLLAHEAGVNGSGPDAVTGNDGSLELGRIVRWVSDSWLEIQGKRNWSWMWTRPTLVIPTGQSTIAGSIPPKRYDTFSAYYDDGTPTGRFIDYLPWDEFRHEYRVLNNTDNVSTWTIQPNNTLAFNAAVSANKNVVLERYANPTALAADGDIPGMPEHLHKVIVWHALVTYANFDEAGVQRSTAVEQYNRLWSQLVDECVPKLRLGPPLGDE